MNVGQVIEALRDAGLLVATSANVPNTVSDLVDDSRRVSQGCAFVAVQGHTQDGHDWLGAAQAAGATLFLVEDVARLSVLPMESAYLHVRDGRRAAAVAAAAFHGWPARELTMVGVTGTNGKTTTVGLLRHLLHRDDAPAASIGTLGVLIGSEGTAVPGGSGLTTPGPVELQRLLRQLRERGVRTVAMEVSSHSLDQRRVEGISFAAAVFTNLTRDHLDYHGTMDAYRVAKLRLVGLLARDGAALFNVDDDAWRGVTNAPRSWTFGVDTLADVSARDVVYHAEGTRFLLVAPSGAGVVSLPLIGDFNVANALGAASAALAIGMSVADVAERLSNAPQVPGRLERLHTAPTVLRDYAHTPDALDRALQAVRPFTQTVDGTHSRLVVVFGCGGDRDRGKRPEMGRIAEERADLAIVTSDNPRTEDPERILDDIEAGMTRGAHRREVDREAAIALALHLTAPADVIVLAGKGHETYQIRGTVSYPFDEREIVQRLVAARAIPSSPTVGDRVP
ncbi:MAG: UDP-N-acetylmuramoyl-L-alanyl-D-glutamate--2,6-diaminopimelate ligase [Gemmatimonadaceae bacterium]|nr:UDP-N-acetylmuramoyl-L-alanyl-D-glutamate--2,6-diaminopimelate ligase [Gemmatimonadaceae bacterium]